MALPVIQKGRKTLKMRQKMCESETVASVYGNLQLPRNTSLVLVRTPSSASCLTYRARVSVCVHGRVCVSVGQRIIFIDLLKIAVSG